VVVVRRVVGRPVRWLGVSRPILRASEWQRDDGRANQQASEWICHRSFPFMECDVILGIL
jgi:hypothetical protein